MAREKLYKIREVGNSEHGKFRIITKNGINIVAFWKFFEYLRENPSIKYRRRKLKEQATSKIVTIDFWRGHKAQNTSLLIEACNDAWEKTYIYFQNKI